MPFDHLTCFFKVLLSENNEKETYNEAMIHKNCTNTYLVSQRCPNTVIDEEEFQ